MFGAHYLVNGWRYGLGVNGVPIGNGWEYRRQAGKTNCRQLTQTIFRSCGRVWCNRHQILIRFTCDSYRFRYFGLHRIIIIIIEHNNGAGLVADQAAERKTAKIRRSQSSVYFSAGVSWKPRSIQLFNIGLSERPGSRNLSYFMWWQRGSVPFQRISVTIQRFNSMLLHDSFSIDRPDH